MDSAKSQLIDRLKTANSVLVTVSRNPSVDQLAACIGLTLIVNKLGKHGSAVFSGSIPSTIEFLKPEETLEKTADSLRDFIIALDKSKADKLRYKVEDQMVKIFITPYKTSLSEKDLEFSQGDFNVELIIALGVKQQEDLDQAIVAHGRILHDATVACINTSEQSDLGNINWQDTTASSLCELITDLTDGIGENLLDEQIATALLTGIIAETDRFSNEKTTSQTMGVSGKLMAAGANQQLVATSLAGPAEATVPKANNTKQASATKSDDGTLNIKHDEEDLKLATLPPPSEQPVQPQPVNTQPPVPPSDNNSAPTNSSPGLPRLVTEPPKLGGTLTANSVPEQYDPSTDPLSNIVAPASDDSGGINPVVTPETSTQPSPPPYNTVQPPNLTPPPPSWTPPEPPTVSAVVPAETSTSNPSFNNVAPAQSDKPKEQTLDDLEKAVDSPHLKEHDLDNAREQVEAILAESPDQKPEADESINALPLGGPLHESQNQPDNNVANGTEQNHNTTGLDPSLFSELPPNNGQSAPPVPPPLNFNNPDNKGNTSGTSQ